MWENYYQTNLVWEKTALSDQKFVARQVFLYFRGSGRFPENGSVSLVSGSGAVPPCPSLTWLLCFTKEQPPKLARLFHPCRKHKNPRFPYNLLFLAFWISLSFFWLFKELLACLSVFAFFPKDFGGSASIQMLAVLVIFLPCLKSGSWKRGG